MLLYRPFPSRHKCVILPLCLSLKVAVMTQNQCASHPITPVETGPAGRVDKHPPPSQSISNSGAKPQIPLHS